MMQGYSPNSLIHAHIEELLLPIGAKLFQALVTMEKAKKFGLPPGLVLIVDDQKRLKGTITDGDVRRALVQGHTGQVAVDKVMVHTPIFVRSSLPSTSVVDEVRRQLEVHGKQSMIKYPILVDDNDHVLGVIDLSKFMLSQAWHWDRIAIVGLGYVGLTLGVSLAEAGFQVVGWDVDESIRGQLRNGYSHVYEKGLESLLATQLADGRFIVANSKNELTDCHVYILTVSTPIQNGKPNLTFVENAVRSTAPHFQ